MLTNGHSSSRNLDNLDYIRSILVRTLSSENVAHSDVLKVRQFARKNHNIYSNCSQVDKEQRLKNIKERQNEERQRKLEEIKAQALAAQRFKEQQEQERRRRLEELRIKEDIRRQQVEERKRAINEAERDRLESILKRNQEREIRLEAKKRNERSNIVFAFGSSTPRMLDPTDAAASFWGTRRATSIQNIASTASSVTRRQSERDIDIGNKKRATSVCGLERSGESSAPTTPAGCASGYVGRRRTDLMPTIPTRDSPSSTFSSRKSLSQSPGRAYSMSRLDQLAKPRKRPDLPSQSDHFNLNHNNNNNISNNNNNTSRPLSSSRMPSSMTRSMIHLAVVSKSGPSPTRKATLNKADSRSMHQLSVDGPILLPRPNRATQLRQQKLNSSSNLSSEASSRPSSSMSQQSTTSVTSSVNVRLRSKATPRRPRPASIALTGVTNENKQPPAPVGNDKDSNKPPIVPTRTKSASKLHQRPLSASLSSSAAAKQLKSPVDSSAKPIVKAKEVKKPEKKEGAAEKKENAVEKKDSAVEKKENVLEKKDNAIEKKEAIMDIKEVKEEKQDVQEKVQKAEPSEIDNKIMSNVPPTTADQILEAPVTEKQQEPIKPVVAVKQPTKDLSDSARFIENEKEATVDKLSQSTISNNNANATNNENTSISVDIDSKENADVMSASFSKPRITTEAEAKAAIAEKRRLMREEAERQAELKRQQEEAEARAERERQQREEEQVRLLIEQQRKAEQERLEEAIKEAQKREEEERQQREEEMRLKLEKEKQAREEAEKAEKLKLELQEKLKNEEKEREARRKRVEAIMTRTRGKTGNANQQNSEDKNENKSDKLNGSKIEEQENTTATKNGKEIQIVDNIIPDETLKNANNVTAINTINSTDTINSNNSWQTNGNFLVNNNS